MDANVSRKRIGNVACLDLRSASAETLASIERIDNAAVVIHSPQNADLVAKLNMVNVAAVTEAPADAKIVIGQERINSASLSEAEEAIDVLVVGQLIFGADMTAELINQRIATITVTGQILYPDTIEGAVQSKIKHITGQSLAYPSDAEVTIGSVKLTQQSLTAMKDASSLFIIGRLAATDILPDALIRQKLRQFAVIGSILCREENSEMLLSRMLSTTLSPSINIIPRGFEWIPGQLALDATLLAVLPSRNLYCSDLSVDANVPADALDQHVDHFIVTSLLIAPQSLSAVMAKKCNLLSTSYVFYTGELWKFDGEDVLDKERFDYLEGKATLIVTGELMLASDIDPKVIAQRVDKVHNLGEITCTPAQRAALQSRMGRDEGEFIVGIDTESPEGIVNTAYLKL